MIFREQTLSDVAALHGVLAEFLHDFARESATVPADQGRLGNGAATYELSRRVRPEAYGYVKSR